MKPKGTLIAIGGNEQKKFKKVDERYHSEFGEGSILFNIISQAGGSERRIEVITSASDVPKMVGETYRKTFKGLGAKNIGILDIRDRETVESPDVLKKIEQADAVMFSGGDQSQISRIFRDTEALELLSDRYMNEDFIIAGTSAGAVVMAEEMIAGGSHNNTLVKSCLKMGKGLGLMKEVIFDSHFIRRGRFGRLAEAVARFPQKLGIGLGEDTGMIITEGNACEIIGTGMIILFDGSHFSHNRYADLKDNVPISLANLTVHILGHGDKYYIREKKSEIYFNPDSQKIKVTELR